MNDERRFIIYHSPFITPMLVSEVWDYGRSQLHSSPTPQLDARLLLEHVLDVSHSWLLTHGDAVLTAVQLTQYRQLIQRASQHEPIPYLIGTAPFFDLDFAVNPSVLIPRPETEQLVELAVSWGREKGGERIIDIGTGSGCIPVILARRLPNAIVAAVDISVDALAIARQNGQKHAPHRIQFYQGNLLEPVSGSFDLITANLPYITNDEWTMLDDGVKLYEPALALKGGADGLGLIRQLLQQARTKLNPGGAIFLEIGWQQGKAAQSLAQSAFPNTQIELISDFADHDRIVVIKTE